MATKSRMLSELGEQDLLLPALVNLALAANDRAKYRFTLLQSARRHAAEPDAPVADLRRERLESGVEDATLDRTVGASRTVPGDRLEIPAFAAIHGALVTDVHAMIAPLEAAVASHRGPQVRPCRPWHDGDPRRPPPRARE